MRALSTAMVLLALTGCAATDGPEVDFEHARLSPGDEQAWSRPAVKSGYHEITVRRTLVAPSACRELRADAVLAAGAVTLRVSAHRTDGDCPPGPARFGYTAVIRDLPGGRYDLRVVHVSADPRRPPEEVLRHPILVE